MQAFFKFLCLIVFGLAAACSPSDTKAEKPSPSTPAPDVTIYVAKTILTLNSDQAKAEAVAVEDGRIVGVGKTTELHNRFKQARLDKTFLDKTITPGLIDPHIHMILGAMMYTKEMAPPWDIETPAGTIKGLADRASFLARLHAINAAHPDNKPLIIYGYHNLVHGKLDRHDLDAITTDRPLIIWHYSGHDFFLNTKALEFAGIDASWGKRFVGVPLGEDGKPTGRVYEDAVFAFLSKTGPQFLSPLSIKKGFDDQLGMFARSGVTSVAEMGYGLFGLKLEDTLYKSFLPQNLATKVYLVPEHRAFEKDFGENRIAEIRRRVKGSENNWPRVLPQIKLFTDAAFYSQTMRLRPPGYTSGQNAGTNGLWVMGPKDKLAKIMRPYWQAGLDVHIHSNGDAAQDATLGALQDVIKDGSKPRQRLIIEHGGLIRPEQIAVAKTMPVGVSVASHYVYYMGELYRKAIGDRVKFMTPLASLTKSGLPVTMHSDAPLAPPQPMRAASVHITRATREGGVSTPSERLTREQALKAITLNAAWSLGLDKEIGSIEIGKQADFTIMEQNPLETKAENWPSIGIWGVVLDGVKKPVFSEK